MLLTNDMKREIGQHFIFGFHGREMTPDIEMLITEYHLGAVILMKRNVVSQGQVKALIRQLQQLAKDAGHPRPLLIGIDQENGLVSSFTKSDAGTQFPGAMSIAATGSLDLAEEVSLASGRELRSVGINWTFSPVADVNSEPTNPVVGVRSFGDDPLNVARFSGAVARGFLKAAVIPCAKHFPGHGDTHVDSHLGLPRIVKAMDDLERTELVPFRSLIQLGVPTIMTGHMSLPQITRDDCPSSLSLHITGGLLRDSLGYRGVVVTDCLEMAAIADKEQGGPGTEKAAPLSLAAGADIAMICHTFSKQVGAVKAVYQAVSDDVLSWKGLVESGERIRVLKDNHVGSWAEVLQEDDPRSAEWAEIKARSASLSAEVYPKTIAVLSDPRRILPLKGYQHIELLSPRGTLSNKAIDGEGSLTQRNTATPSSIDLASAIGKRVGYTHTVYSEESPPPSPSSLDSATIFLMHNSNSAEWQLSCLKSALSSRTTPIVVLSGCGPYDLMGFSDANEVAHVASFEFTAAAFEAAVGVIFGENEGVGVVPVTIRI